ncbi:MAG: hypothetical protein IPM35_02530 [Myxococcales bacterium]|nr:hypothetical protein [Myxococcales bacterium]
MRRPVVVLLGVESCGPLDLGDAVERLRCGLRALRRRVVTRGVGAAVGLVECERRGSAWRPHVHLVCDAEPGVDWGRVAAEWRLLGGHGAVLSVDGPVRSAGAIAAYATKARTWCPEPGSLPPRVYGQLRGVLHGRRLLVEWRPRAAERSARCDR